MEDLNLVRCVGDLGPVVPPVGSRYGILPAGSELRFYGDGRWGGAPLLVVLH